MSSPRDDGGPAFPATEANGLNSGMPGMTLRDYIAVEAMKPILENVFAIARMGADASELSDTACRHAYQVADEMLEARK